MATARNPASATGPIWWRQEYQLSGNPWTIRTSGPSPSEATRMRTPSASSSVSKAIIGDHPSAISADADRA